MGGIGRPRGAVGGGPGLIEDHVVRVDLHVGNVVRTQHTRRSRADGRSGEGTRLVGHIGLGGRDGAVAFDPHLALDITAGPGASGFEDLGAAHDHLDRTTGLVRHHGRRRLHVDGELATKAAADFAGIDLHLADGLLQHLGYLFTDLKGALGADPYGDGTIALPQDRCILRLDIPLMDGGRAEFALDDLVSFGKAGLDVAHLLAVVAGDIALAVGLFAQFAGCALLVQERGTLFHGLQNVDHRRQWLVVDLDQLEGLLGDMRTDGGHGGHGMSLVKDLARGQGVGGDVADIHTRLADVGHAVHGLHQVIGRGHGPHTLQLHRLRRIDILDTGVRMGAAQQLAVEHVSRSYIGAVHGAARDLVLAIVTDRTGADDLVFAFTGEFGIGRVGRHTGWFSLGGRIGPKG